MATLPVAARARAFARPRALRPLVGAGALTECLAVSSVLVLALVVRLPNFTAIPVFTDEVEEVGLAFAILRDGARPLTNVDPYMGPLWNYILAAAFAIVGPSLQTARALVLAAGTVTAVLTYGLGRSLFGPRVGIIGGVLMATSAVHTVVNSHVAWSNCVTPLFTTIALLLVSLALRHNRPWLLAPAGLSLGIAFHTHPTAAPIVAAVGVTCLGVSRGLLAPAPRSSDGPLGSTRRLGWMPTPWPYVAVGLAAMVNLNLVIYNVITGGRSFTYAREIQEDYIREVGRSDTYPERLLDLLVNLPRVVGGPLEARASYAELLLTPMLWLAAVLLLAGIVLAVRRRAWLPVITVAATVATLPLVNPKYEPILNGRYLASVLPVCMLLVALALDEVFAAVSRSSRSGWRLGGATLAGLALAALALMPLYELQQYYGNVRENFKTGERVLETVAIAKQAGTPGHPVMLDERLDKVTLGPGAGSVLRTLRVSMEMAGVPTEVVWLGRERPEEAREGQLVVLASRQKPQFTADAVVDLGLRSPTGRAPTVQGQASLYALYRFGRSP